MYNVFNIKMVHVEFCHATTCGKKLSVMTYIYTTQASIEVTLRYILANYWKLFNAWMKPRKLH